MAPFRTLQAPAAPEVPAPQTSPRLLSFGLTGELYRLAYGAASEVRLVALDRRNGRIAASESLAASSACAAAVGHDGWSVFDRRAEHVLAWSPPARRPCRFALGATSERDTQFVGFSYDGEPCVVLAHPGDPGDRARGPRIRVLDASLSIEHTPPWFAPPSSRTLLAATATVYGAVALFAADREDELDVCVAARQGETVHRTVSLGRGQRFASAVGGGGRIVLVSRAGDSLVVRTLASDVRSELNPVPIQARTGWRVGAVRCAYANGPFVVAHAEHAEREHAAVVTVFDNGRTVTSRVELPTVDAVAVDGKDVTVAALAGGHSGPMLHVQRMQLGGGRHRRYAYLLDAARCDLPDRRRALLADVADVLALSLGASAPRALHLRALDGRTDAAMFSLPGPDAAHDVWFALSLRSDESGTAWVRIGGARPTEPFDARASVFRVGVSEAARDPHTARLDLRRLAGSVESIVSAVGALRAVR